jgi:hypothetical protein
VFFVTSTSVLVAMGETEADPVALLVSFLAAAGVLFGKCATGWACGKAHPPVDYFLLEGRTGEGRKGTATGHALSVVKVVDPEFERLHIVRGLADKERRKSRWQY